MNTISSLVLVTCTGDRPEAFALCEKYMARQTAKDKIVEWIILDDGKEPTKLSHELTYTHRPEWRGPASLVNKIRFACQYIRTNYIDPDKVGVVFIEDDDWYAPTYLETVLRWLQTDDVVGEGEAVYYNVKRRWWWPHDNLRHASLCSTALRANRLNYLEEVCSSEDPFIDLRFWQLVQRRAVRSRVWGVGVNGVRRQCVGIKSMPGRLGYGTGHRDSAASRLPQDPTLAKLIELIGELDAQAYAGFYVPPAHTPIAEVNMSNWSRWTGHLTGEPEIVGLEIGPGEGLVTKWLLRNVFTNPTSTLYCLDAFAGLPEYYYQGAPCSAQEHRLHSELDGFKPLRIMRGAPGRTLRSVALRSPDFIVIGEPTDAASSLSHATLAFELLKVGGILVFNLTTRVAVESFLSCFQKQLTILAPRTLKQTAIQKKSV